MVGALKSSIKFNNLPIIFQFQRWINFNKWLLFTILGPISQCSVCKKSFHWHCVYDAAIPEPAKGVLKCNLCQEEKACDLTSISNDILPGKWTLFSFFKFNSRALVCWFGVLIMLLFLTGANLCVVQLLFFFMLSITICFF